MFKIYSIVISTVVLVLLTVNANATSGQGSGTPGSSSGMGQGMQGSGTQPVQNQNQVQTQNRGEEQQLQVQTQESQGDETGKGVNGNSQGAGTQGNKNGLNQSISSVGRQIQNLLGIKSPAGGAGDQVKEWARAQNQSQEKIKEHLAKVEAKTGLAKSFFGPNYGSLNELKREMQQNRVRIQQLEQLQNKLSNQGDISQVQEMITLMTQENTALQERITAEEKYSSVFGWLLKLFAK